MKDNKKYLLVVGGPTAVGKTDFSIRLAKHYSTEIISADSRQLYQKLNIGTAKPTAKELAAVRHHFIDVLPPGQDYSAGMFEKDALKLLDKLFLEHDEVVLAGGSGMYVQALCQGIDDMPEVPVTIREQLNERLEREGLQSLLLDLEKFDPDYFQEVDRHNPQRVIRALEICIYTALPYSSFRKKNMAQRPFSTIKVGLERSREELYARIDLRMEQMIAEGLFEEASGLYNYRHLNALQTVGYKEIFEYLDGKYDREEAIRLLKRNSRRYAKRQLTWFRKDPGFKWFHPRALENVIEYIDKQKGKAAET